LGTPKVRAALAIYSEKPVFTRSGLERRFLEVVTAAGLPEPSMNAFVAGHEIDAYWEAERFGVELDVFETHGSRLRPSTSGASRALAPGIRLDGGREDRDRRRGGGDRSGDRALRVGVRRRFACRAPGRGRTVAAPGAAGGSGRQADDPGPTRRRSEMAVVKIIELVGSSKTSTDDAAKQALAQAQGSLRNIRAVDIVSTGIRGENLDEFRAHVRVAFLIEGSEVD
jgi:flavin-binding protein dodecin